MLSCLPGQQNKTRVFYHHLCVDQRGYYKLTDIKGVLTGQRRDFNMDHVQKHLKYLKVFLIHFFRHLKGPKVGHERVKLAALSYTQLLRFLLV